MASVSPYETKSGKRWRVQYRDPAGKVRTKRGFKRKSDAQAWADKNAVAVADGDWVSHEDKQATVGEYAELWRARLSRRAEGTRRVYVPCWEQHVAPVWETRKVGSIKPSQVQAWVDEQTLGPVMVKRMVNLLAQVLDIAVKDGVLKSNPARGVETPAKPKPKQVFLTAEQLAHLADESKYPEIMWVLGTVGLRWGELAALRVRNVNVLRSRFSIVEAAKTNDKIVTVGETKTGEQREVAVPRFVMEMVTPLLEGKAPDDFVWAAQDGGPMRRPTANDGWFAGAVERCRCKDPEFPYVSPHGLRHVAAGLMIHAGANVKAVQKQLGHATAAMTLDTYSALWDDDLDAVATAVENVVKMQSRTG